MADTNYPSTTLKSKETEETRAEKITRGGVVQKKKTTGKRIAESLISEDGKSVKDYVIFDVVVPAIKDLLASIINTATDMFIYGKDGSSSGKLCDGSPNVISYDRMYRSGSSDRKVARDAYTIEELVFEERGDAERVLDELREQIEKFGQVSVWYYYDLCGMTADYTLKNLIWCDLDYVDIQRERGTTRYYINLPRPQRK